MTTTLYSLAIAILWSSLFILALFVCRRSNRFIRLFGANALIILLVGCLLRLFLPVEFSFTKVITNQSLLNPLNDILYSTIQIGKYSISIGKLTAIIWALVALILSLFFVFSYIRYAGKIKELPVAETKQILNISRSIFADKNSEKIKVVFGPADTVPQVIGFFRATVVLPKIDYGNRDLYYILKHEYAHFRNHDAWVKLLATLFCIAFWWNPFAYLLKFDLETTLELKCDLWVTAYERSAIPYMDTIMRVIEQTNTAKRTKVPFITSEMARGKSMMQRFILLREHRRKHHTVIKATFAIFLVSTLIVSYFFVLQPVYQPPLNDFSSHEVIESKTYIIPNKDGTYTVHDGKTTYVINEQYKEIMEADGFPVIKSQDERRDDK